MLGMRFRRKGERNVNAVSKLMLYLLESRGEQALNSLAPTADRRYGKKSFTNALHQPGSAAY